MAGKLKKILGDKYLEYLVLLGTLLVALLFFAIAWAASGNYIPQFLSSATNCRDPQNANTPYCQNRKGQIESNWRSISRYHQGKSNPFTLYKKGR